MRSLIKMLGNVALIVGGFFVVFFGVSKATHQSNSQDLDMSAPNLNDSGVAYADIPSCGDSGDSSGDSSGK